MEKRLRGMRRDLLQRISSEEYYKLIDYIVKIDTADYDLKIFMARKFSNLYTALYPLAREEHGGKGRKEYEKMISAREKDNKEPPVIISDRALFMLRKDISKGAYKSVLLADDIVIHGRTLDTIYGKLKEWLKQNSFEEENLALTAYVMSTDPVIEKIFEKKPNTEYEYPTGKWRSISDEIVEIFYLTGTPYTSYVPNMRIPADSQWGERLSRISSDDMELVIPDKSSHIVSEAAQMFIYSEQNPTSFALNCSVRLYKFRNISEYVFVPMVMLKPWDEDMLRKCILHCRNLEILNENFADSVTQITDNEIIYRTVVYILSAIWGMIFLLEKSEIPESFMFYDEWEEKLNFAMPVLKKEVFRKSSIDQLKFIWGKITSEFDEKVFEDNIQTIRTELKKNDDFIILDNAFHDLLKDNANELSTVEEMLGQFLYVNGRIDEDRCKEDDKESSKRLMGYPLIVLADQVDFKAWVRAILLAIDSGKGSIVPAKIRIGNEIYYFAVIHAGEQNFKYIEERYFPQLYGLYNLENTPNINDLSKKKSDFLKKYFTYWAKKGKKYPASDVERLRKINVTADYKEVILGDIWSHFNADDLNYAITLSKKNAVSEGTEDNDH